MVAQLVQVALDVAGRQARRAAGEDGVDGVPRQQCAVVAAGDVGLVVVARHHRGHTREHPRLRVAYGNEVLRVLEVVQIGGVVLRAAGLSGYELGKLARELYL